MPEITEQGRAGLDYLEAITDLLHRVRLAHPTAGLYEAGEVQWWWSQNARPTDNVEQRFWFDNDGRPVAAVIATQFGEQMQLDPIVMPDATPDWVAHVMHRGLEFASELGADTVELEVDQEDDVLRSVLTEHGLAVDGDGLIESWMPAEARPPISPVPDGYRLTDRSAPDRPHHMINVRRIHTDPEPRMKQTSLYRPDLDLAIYDDQGNVGAYGLFWYDPITGVGLLEPMRTNDDHQQRGLAKALLTAGIDRLAEAGAQRIKVCFEPGSPASGSLYLGAGFEPDRRNDMFSGPTAANITQPTRRAGEPPSELSGR